MKKAACILLLRSDGKFLGASRRNKPNDFNLVGGKVDPGETVLEAAIREFNEEAGARLNSKNLIQVFTRPCFGETDYETTTFLVFQKLDLASQTIDLENPSSPEPGITIKWITWDELLNPTNSFYEYNKSLYEAVKPLLGQK